MIQIDEVTHKFTRVYHTIDDINNLLIRIRLVDDNDEDNGDETIVTFKWQQKRFSPHERTFYADEKNCLSDLERFYHQELRNDKADENFDRNPQDLIFSYVSKDGYVPNEQLLTYRHGNTDKIRLKRQNELSNENELSKLLQEEISLENDNQQTTNGQDDDNIEEYDYLTSLMHAEETVISKDTAMAANYLEAMHIMADFGEFYQSNWMRGEHTLCTLKYNAPKKLLMMTPDFTQFEPHELRVTTDGTKTIRYFIENATLDGVTRAELLREVTLLNQVAREKQKEQQSATEKILTDHQSHRDVRMHIHLEIQTACGFDHDNVFVRYYFVLNNWRVVGSNSNGNSNNNDTSQPLTGVTMASARSNRRNYHHFGFPIEVALESKYNSRESPPVCYFEVISKDTWSRYRSEGVAYLALQPGTSATSMALQCYRFSSAGGIAAALRRFYIGDCANYNDLKQIGASIHDCKQGHMNRLATQTVSTGVLQVRCWLMHVLPLNEDEEEQSNGDEGKYVQDSKRQMRLKTNLQDPQLTQSVHQVVDAFQRARAAMMSVRDAV